MMQCEKTGVSKYDDETILEVTLVGGYHTALCFTARADWLNFITTHPVLKEKEICEARLFVLQRRIKSGDFASADQYIVRMQQHQNLENQLFQLAKEWVGNDGE